MSWSFSRSSIVVLDRCSTNIQLFGTSEDGKLEVLQQCEEATIQSPISLHQRPRHELITSHRSSVFLVNYEFINQRDQEATQSLKTTQLEIQRVFNEGSSLFMRPDSLHPQAWPQDPKRQNFTTLTPPNTTVTEKVQHFNYMMTPK